MQRGTVPRVYLADLTVKPANVTVCVRVMRKWIYDGSEPGGPIRHMDFVLADEKGDAMYAQILAAHVSTKGDLLQLDKVYIIGKFNVRVSNRDYVPFPKKLMIEFTSYTTVIPVRDPPGTFPAFVYTITPFSNIDPFGPTAKNFIDVLGIITYVDIPRQIALKKRERVATIRDIHIKDLSNQELKVTLWGDQATGFNLGDISTSQNNHSVVVLFVGCLAKSINNKTHVSGGNACRWFFNPDIREAVPLYDSLKKIPVPIEYVAPEEPQNQTIAQPVILQHLTLAELNSFDPFEFPEEGCKCTVTITAIPQEKRWWYIGCAKCKRAPTDDHVTFRCSGCNCTNSRTFYRLSFTASDDTAEGNFFCYDDEARMIIRRNVETLRNMEAKNPGFPREITALISKKFTFAVGLTADSFYDANPRTYLVKYTVIDHDFQAARERLHLQGQQSGQASSTALAIVGTPPTTQTSDLVLQTPPPTLPVDDTPQKKNPTSEGKSIADTHVFHKQMVARNIFPTTFSTDEERLQSNISSSASQLKLVQEHESGGSTPGQQNISTQNKDLTQNEKVHAAVPITDKKSIGCTLSPQPKTKRPKTTETGQEAGNTATTDATAKTKL